MQSNLRTFGDLQSNSYEMERTTSKLTLEKVFADRGIDYLNEHTLFLAHFNAIPNCTNEIRIDCRKANKWFSENYKGEIKDFHFNERFYGNGNNVELDDVFYFLYEDLLVNFDINQSVVRFLFRKTNVLKVEKVIEDIRKFRKRKGRRSPMISLLVNSHTGIELKSMLISKPKLNIEDNYNDDFKVVHQTIIKRLAKKNDKGLVLLHGKPGTGKTSYIRYLISILKKEIIFLPPNMAGVITNPNLIAMLINNPNSIFVIEDAENIIVDRENDGNSPVSALLNISDGLLSDCLNVQIICSFNTPLSKVDSALLRKGRLIAKYEFNELQVEKAQSLSDKLGFKTTFNSPMALTGIYNQEEKDFVGEKSKIPIGFKMVSSEW